MTDCEPVSVTKGGSFRVGDEANIFLIGIGTKIVIGACDVENGTKCIKNIVCWVRYCITVLLLWITSAVTNK